MAEQTVKEALASAKKVLVGLGEEWKWKREAAEAAETAGVAGAGNAPANSREALLAAYEGLYEWIKDTDYFIVTMATDGLIFETPLGSQTETVVSMDASAADVSCPAVEGKAKEVMDRLFPAKEPARREADTRIQRIVAPCGNENWQQCSQGCTKDIWEPSPLRRAADGQYDRSPSLHRGGLPAPVGAVYPLADGDPEPGSGDPGAGRGLFPASGHPVPV